MVTHLTFRSDPDAETVLQFVDVRFSVKDISISDIDDVASANNCARLWNPQNETKIEDYHQSMERGDVFPRIVVEDATSGLVVLGGNQRVCAVKRFVDVGPISAYVVSALTSTQRDVLIRSLNSRHGWGSEKEERIEHAVYVVRKHGVSVHDAARLMVVSESTINERIRAEATRALVAAKGIDTSRMPVSSLSALSRVKNEKAMINLASTAVKHKATCEQLLSAVRAVENAKSVSDITKAAKEFDSSMSQSMRSESKGSRVIKRPRRDKLLRLLESLSQFLDRGNDGTGFSSFDELQCVGDDCDKARVMAVKIVIRLKTITGV